MRIKEHTTPNIKAYFKQKTSEYLTYAEWHIEQAKKETFATPKKHHDDMAWKYSVNYPALLSDIEKDILKII